MVLSKKELKDVLCLLRHILDREDFGRNSCGLTPGEREAYLMMLQSQKLIKKLKSGRILKNRVKITEHIIITDEGKAFLNKNSDNIQS